MAETFIKNENGEEWFDVLDAMHFVVDGCQRYTGKWMEPLNCYCALGVLVQGNLDLERFQRAVQRVYEENQALRVQFAKQDGTIKFRIYEHYTYQMQVDDLRMEGTQALEKGKEKCSQYSRFPGYDEYGVSFRVPLIRIGDDAYIILYLLDHAVGDGYSLGLLTQMIATYYEDAESDLFQGRGTFLEYYNLAKEREKLPENPYWMEQVQKIALDMQTPAPVKEEPFRMEECLLRIPNDVLKEAGVACKVTPAVVILTVSHMMQQCLYGKDETCIDLYLANRTEKKFQQTVGLFTSAMPHRLEVHAQDSLADICKRSMAQMVHGMQEERNRQIYIGDVILTYMSSSAMDMVQGIPGCKWEFLETQANIGAFSYDGFLMQVNSREKETLYQIGIRPELHGEHVRKIRQWMPSLLQAMKEHPEQTIGQWKKEHVGQAESKKKRIVVCGTGFGSLYLDAIAKDSDLDVIGILSKGSSQSMELAKKNGVPLYTDVDAVPWQECDLALVAVKSLISGGSGGKLAQKILEQGVSVLQEQPVHWQEVKTLQQVAKEHGCTYSINNFYRELPAVKQMIIEARKLREQTILSELFVTCSFQVLYPVLDILDEIFEPLELERVELLSKQRLVVLQGIINRIPFHLQLYHEYNPVNLDDSMAVMFRMDFETNGGNLVLTDPQGMLLWQSHFLMPFDENHRFDRACEQLYEYAPVRILSEPTCECYGDLYDVLWPNAMAESIKAFGKEPERLENLTLQWNEIGKVAGMPIKIQTRYRMHDVIHV